ncbi:MAG: hypothetical protein JWL97_2963 [Gemmatimonadales bacterium]|nr:hypothetical protein [Gemmatimonadales bacterium]
MTSQFGEDGVLRAIFERIGVRRNWFVEFGAWDGEHLSNCFTLLRDQRWSGVMIECDPAKAAGLRRTAARFPGLHAIEATVQVSGPNSLAHLLAGTQTPRDFDVLSIDVDNDDYFLWDAFKGYRPRVVVLEVNTEFGPDMVKLPELNYRGWSHRTGCSFAAAVQLAKRKGYELALHTGNCIFVERQYATLLEIDTDGWRSLFDDSPAIKGVAKKLRTYAGDLAHGRVAFH